MNIGHDGKEYYILITRPNGSSYKISEDKQSLIIFRGKNEEGKKQDNQQTKGRIMYIMVGQNCPN